jgi:hypothetical protein
MASAFPPVRLENSFFHVERCAACGRGWEMHDPPVPTYFTVASIEVDDPPVPVCDLCIEQHDPARFDALLAERQRFYS